jgi:hypothetical protein
MNKQKLASILLWVGTLYAVVFAGIASWNLTHKLRTLSSEELGSSVWSLDGPMFGLWALSVPLGCLLAGIGVLLYVKVRVSFIWLASIGYLIVVILMTFIFGAKYFPPLFGIGGCLILIIFFSIVSLWKKEYAALSIQEKAAGSFKLIGYLFWMNASWFLCGEFGSLHQKAFEGRSAPSPIEILVYLVLGWLFLLVGDYKLLSLKKNESPADYVTTISS